MNYLFYSVFGGIWPIVIIICFAYLFIKVSRLNKRIETLESGVSSTVPADHVRTAPSIAPSAAPAPAPAPLPPPELAKESQEETSARWLGWTGAIMLLLGLSFFLKYAFDHWIGPSGQVATGILGGILILLIAQKLRAKYLKYSDMLFGAGIGILYLTIYAGFAFYQTPVINQPVAFFLMILVTALSMAIAVAGGTLSIAVLGVLGGFLTPILLSTGENHLVTLSLYMIVLNLGVLGVSSFKKWAQLNYLSFLGTILLFGGWFQRFYHTDPDGQLGVTFFFLSAFFVLFLGNSIIHHFVRKESSTWGDLGLLVINAAWYFSTAYTMLDPKHHDVLGFFALLLAVVYFVVSYVAYTSYKHDRTLNLFLPGIAVVFLSIAVPLQLSGYWISVAWLVESVILVYTGLFLGEKVIQVFGWLVLFVGMGSMLNEANMIRNKGLGYYYGSEMKIEDLITPVFNMAFFLYVLGVAAFYVICGLYAKWQNPVNDWKKIVTVFLVLANILSIYALTKEVSLPFDREMVKVSRAAEAKAAQERAYQGDAGYNDTFRYDQPLDTTYEEQRALRNKENTAVSVLWAVYATLLLVIGFMRRVRALRIFGLIFFFITMLKVLIDVWDFGQIYRIISTMVVGIIALGAAFLYAKYKDRIKEII